MHVYIYMNMSSIFLVTRKPPWNNEHGNESLFFMAVTGAGITVHTNLCERLSVRVAVARVALRQCCAYAVCVCHCL